MQTNQCFSEDVIDFIRATIKEAYNNEVFFTGKIDEKGIVFKIDVGSRGNEHTVPVNFYQTKSASVLIHNHPSGNLTPSSADLQIAQKISQNAKGFYIINNDVTEVYKVVEPPLPKKKVLINEEKAAFYISDGGELSKIDEYFEERKVQILLLKEIAKAFNNNQLGVFEAGTGVGKSYAYLIPSILWAINNDEKVIISTGTINLQQQLCQKDIPAVEKILNKKINFVLLKGRQNYICKRRLNDFASMLELFEDETQEIKQIAQWAVNSTNGSKSELTFMPSENSWSKVCSESDACMGMKCPYFSECFVMKQRKLANNANIIVVNHHLLFADIQSRINGAGFDDAAVLPPFRRIVFDEAHGIENAATSFFSESFTRFKLNKLINQMYRRRKNSEAGHLCTLAIMSSNEEKASFAYEITNNIKQSLTTLEITGLDLLQNENTKRLYNNTKRDFGPFLVSVNDLAKNLGEFSNLIRIVADGISDDDKDIPAMWETKLILRRIENYIILLKNFAIWEEKEGDVFWLQKKRLSSELLKTQTNPYFIVLNQTPLDISFLMNEGVFEPMESVICTSATIKTSKDFNYFKERTGLFLAEQDRIITKDFPSPFNYEKNMLFAVPNDAPSPERSEFQQYIEMAIPKLIQASLGRTLVLFTSYESLKSAHNSCIASLRGFSGRILRQGEDDNAKLLEHFKNEKESVLFATDSFWQGVDVPGDSLSQVIIVKLPFTVPSDPVFVARGEAIEKKGGSSFMQLSIPEAVIKFRQGIGRLIRRSDDKGAVVVLDKRIVEKRYGAFFTLACGECKKIYEPLQEICNKVNRFIFD